MKNNFWLKLNKPFFVLAPMEAVTDNVFRELVAKYAKPNVLFTEFTSCDALCSSGYNKTINRLKFTRKQKPIVAQVWGNNPDNFFKTAKIVEKLGFNGIDINMGCPDANVIKKGSGSGLIKTPDIAADIILQTKKGAPNIAISVKTRLGLKKIQTDEWIPFLLNQKIDALTIHLRTEAEKSKVPAHYEELQKIVEFKNKISPKTVIIANGDIFNIDTGIDIYNKYKIDGVMIARGIFSNFFVFNNKKQPTKKELFKILLEHTKNYEKEYKNKRNFDNMKKFFKVYIREFEGATDLKLKLMDCKNYKEVQKVIKSF